MNIQLLLIGKTGFPFIREGMEEYEKRLNKYVNFTIRIIPEIKAGRSWSMDQIAGQEGKKILKSLKDGDFAVLLDERGENPDSFEFARFIEKQTVDSVKSLVFVVGGAYGFSREVYDRGDKLLSLSRMTFSHQLIRLYFMEQLYRAFTILRGEPYHHG